MREATRQERIDALKATIAKLQGELSALKQVEQAGGVTGQVKTTLSTRKVETKSFVDPNPAPQAAPTAPRAQPPEPAPPRKPARLLGDAEKKDLAPDVIFLVDGKAATKGELEAAMTYLQSYPQTRSTEELRAQAVLELIKLKAAQAAFPETEKKAKERILAIQKELQGGKIEFAELAQKSSDCPSKARGGDLGEFGRVGMDFWFTRGSFELEVGETSEVIESSFGYHLIKLTAKKGDTPEEQRVQASHILALYAPSQVELAQVARRVNAGQADVAFVTDEYRNYAPQAFK